MGGLPLGNLLPPQQSLDTWLQAAGMGWTIEQSEVMFNVASDTLDPLSVVSQRYNVVQPHEVQHFYQDLVDAGSFELDSVIIA